MPLCALTFADVISKQLRLLRWTIQPNDEYVEHFTALENDGEALNRSNMANSTKYESICLA